jgi:hypothetical protein
MKNLLFVLALVLAAAVPSALPAQDYSDEGDPAENAAARPAAAAFLKVVDAARYGETYDMAGENLRGTLSKKEWAGDLQKARTSVGKLESRELIGVRHTFKIPDGPPGNYYFVFYHSRYGGRDWQEKVIFDLKGKDYRVEGSFIVPSDASGMVPTQ